ncbi:MAG: DUF4405 domain-containing protein [Clostridiaceae bacterium]
MNKKFKIKMVIDLIMLILWIVLMDLNLTGVFVHEYLGIGIIALIIIHNLLNLRWIAGVISNFKKSPGKVKFVLNLVLMALTVLIGVSGVMISTDILPTLSRANISVWQYIHKTASYGGMLLISVHIGLHWSMIAGALKKAFRIYGKSRLRKVLCACISLLIMFSGIYSSLKIGLAGKFIPETKKSGKEIKAYTLTAYVSADNQSVGTLADYLGNLVCTACHRHCPLTAPQCSRGESQAQTATAEYEKLKAAAGTEDSPENEDSTVSTNSTVNTGNSSTSEAVNETKTTETTETTETTNAASTSDGSETSENAGFTDVIPIMGMVVCGTFYMVKLRKKTEI